MNELLILGVIGVAVVLGVLLLFAVMFRKVVPTNEVHIAQSSKDTKSYGKDTGNGNVYYRIPSFVPLFGIEVKSMPVSIFNIELTEYEAYDKGRLQFLVDVVAFFRISDYGQAAQRVATINELESQLTDIVRGAVRSILAKSEIEEIMEERSVFGEKFTSEVREQLKSWGVEAVKNIELMDVKDAEKSNIIHNIMEKKKSHIEMESRLEVAKNMKTAQVAEIEARREVDLGKQEAAQTVGLRTATAEREVELAVETKRQAVMDQAKLTAFKEMEIINVKETKAAEIQRSVAKVHAEQDKEVALVQANKIRETNIIRANADYEVKNRDAEAYLEVKKKEAAADYEVKAKDAEANLIKATNNAKGLEAEGLAKAVAEKAFLMAPVEAQTALAKEIGENKEYQTYLITVERIKADQVVGVEQAKAMTAADVKIIANAGSASEGIKSATELLSSKGGLQLGAMLEGLANTDMGKKLVDKLN